MIFRGSRNLTLFYRVSIENPQSWGSKVQALQGQLSGRVPPLWRSVRFDPPIPVSEHPLWHEMDLAITEVRLMASESQLQNDVFVTAIKTLQSQTGTGSLSEVDKRLAVLESRPVETASSTVTFATDESNTPSLGMTMSIERVQVLESLAASFFFSPSASLNLLVARAIRNAIRTNRFARAIRN